MRKEVFLKAVINVVYLYVVYVLILVVTSLPAIKNVWLINTGTFSDILLNVVGSIVCFVILILAGKFLYKSYTRYSMKFKTGKEVRCNPFNPFC